MQRDFTFKSGIYLVKGDRELDLHNDFDFCEVHYSVSERLISLIWGRRLAGVANTQPTFVRLDFFEVREFRFVARDPELPFTEDDCLHSAGYWVDAEWCQDVMISDSEPDPNWLIAFEFISAAMIAVQAARAAATIGDGAPT